MSAEKLQQLAESKFDIKVAKLNLLERVEAQLTFPYNGGLFKATPELMAVLALYTKDSVVDLVLLDEYQTPIRVVISELTRKVLEAHQFALNAYLSDYAHLKGVRRGDKL